MYGAGGSQRILGASLSGLKGLWLGRAFSTSAPSLDLVVARARASAKRLGRPLDLRYALWPNPLVSDRLSMAGMRRLREEGSIAKVGVSDYDLDRWQRAEQQLGSPGS